MKEIATRNTIDVVQHGLALHLLQSHVATVTSACHSISTNPEAYTKLSICAVATGLWRSSRVLCVCAQDGCQLLGNEKLLQTFKCPHQQLRCCSTM